MACPHLKSGWTYTQCTFYSKAYNQRNVDCDHRIKYCDKNDQNNSKGCNCFRRFANNY